MIEDKLAGDSLKQRFKHFNRLVSEVKPNEFTPDYMEQLSTGNLPDRLFLIELANRFKDPKLVCRMLKSEDGAITAKVLKCGWFFEGDSIEADIFFTNVFSEVSFSTKCKILTQMRIHLKNNKTAEEFYMKVLDKYGILMALKLLSACSEDFVKYEIQSGKLKLSEKQLQCIYKKYPKIIVENLEYINIEKNSAIIERIALDFPEKFFTILTEKKCSTFPRMGYNTTLALIKHNKKIIIEQGSRFVEFLNLEAVLKKLKGDERDMFIKNCFPSKQINFSYEGNVFIIFKHFKKDYAAAYLIKLYKDLYNDDILNGEHFPEELLEHLPIETRSEWAKKKMRLKDGNEEKYLKYLEPGVCYKRCLELISYANRSEERIELLKSIVDCCKMNNNTEILLDLLKYTLIRHKNDSFRITFLDYLREAFSLRTLSKEHWDVIDELLTILLCNGEIHAYTYSSRIFYMKIVEESFHFRLTNNIEIDSLIKNVSELRPDTLLFLKDNPEYRDVILDAFIEKYRNLLEKDENTEGERDEEDTEGKLSLLLETFNKCKNPIRSINNYPWFTKAIRDFLDKQDSFSYLSYELNRNTETREMFAFDIFKRINDYEILKNILIHNFTILQNDIDLLVTKLLESKKDLRLSNVLTTFLNKPLGDAIVKHLKDKIEKYDRECSSEFANLLNLSSMFMKTDEFEKTLVQYTPSTVKVQLKNSENQIEYIRTQALLENLKNIDPPLSFDLISIFAKGDYLKFTLPAVMFMSMKKSEISVISFLQNISESAISLKKHYLRLCYYFYPREKLLSIYSDVWNSEKHVSIRNVVFQRTFKIFTTERDRKITRLALDSLKDYYKSFQESDKGLFDYIQSIDKVHDEYVSEYFETCWNILTMLDKFELHTENYKISLMDYAVINIDKMNDDVCKLLFEEYLVLIEKFEGKLFELLSRFCFNYILKLKSGGCQREFIEKFCESLKFHIAIKWDVVDKKQHVYKNRIEDLMNLFCKEITTLKSTTINPMSFLDNVYKTTKSIIPFRVASKIHLKFVFVIFFTELSGQNLDFSTDNQTEFFDKFANLTRGYYDDFMYNYGFHLNSILVSAFKDFVGYFEKSDAFVIRLVEKMISLDDKSRSYMFLLYDLIKDIDLEYFDEPLDCVFQRIVEDMWCFDDEIFRIALGCTFHKPLSFYESK